MSRARPVLFPPAPSALLLLALCACDEGAEPLRAPIIEAARPAQARPGQPVTLVGRNFGLPGEHDLVRLGGQPVPVEDWAERALLVRVPAAAGPGVFDFVVRTGALVSAPFAFEVLPAAEDVRGVAP